MRISDWSSDVCSSDLRQAARADLVFGWVQFAWTVLMVSSSSSLLTCIAYQAKPHECKAGRTPFFHTSLRRSEEHTSELQSLMRISYAVFCLKKKKELTLRDINTSCTM